MDTYSLSQGYTVAGVVTGKPVNLGGSLGRIKAMGRGVYICGVETVKKVGLEPNGAKVTVQGYGNVGSEAALLFYDAHAKIVSIQHYTGIIYNADGIDISKLNEYVEKFGGVYGFQNSTYIESEEFWDVDMDILIAAALEGQITEERAKRIKAQIILEGANGLTYPEAGDILIKRGKTIVPDVICNAGGVTVSYFEWVQDISNFFGQKKKLIKN